LDVLTPASQSTPTVWHNTDTDLLVCNAVSSPLEQPH
jgi:hypothetical protein